MASLRDTRRNIRADVSLTSEKAFDRTLWNLVGSRSSSGETVTEATALTLSAFYNGVALISGTIASLPLHLMQRKGERKRIADDLKLYRIMHDEWNPYMTAMAGRECLLSHVLTWGNGYAEKVRNEYGELAELWPITPERVRPEMDGSQLVYRIRVGNEDVLFPRDKILHVPGLGFDGFVGYSVVAMARRSLGLGMALEEFGSRYFGSGTHPGIIVKHPGKLSDLAHKNLAGSLTAAYSGLGQAHRLMLLEEGMDAVKLGVPPNDSQFLESKQHHVSDVARWLNLPPHKLKDLSRSSFSNIESEQRSFFVDSLMPWIVRLEQNYAMQLLTPYDKALSGRGRLYFKHSAEGILRGDTAARAAFYTQMFGIGVYSTNDIRALEDEDPVEGGDVRMVPGNMTTLKDAGKLMNPDRQKKQIPPPKGPTPGDEGGMGEGEEMGRATA